MEKLRVVVNPVHRKYNVKINGLADLTGAGRLKNLRGLVTGLFRFERIQSTEKRVEEGRPYAELLLMEAIKYGPRHKPTMELMDFWMVEKDMIHRVFDVYAPRFARFEPPFTRIWYVPGRLPGLGLSHKQVLLELKGNPYPPVEPRHLDNRGSLANVLLGEAKRDYVRQQLREQSDGAKLELDGDFTGQRVN